MKYLLVLVILAIAASHLWRQLRRHFQATPGARPARRPQQAMVRCSRCGVHLPRNESYYRAGQAYCSLDHARSAGCNTACGATSGQQDMPPS